MSILENQIDVIISTVKQQSQDVIMNDQLSSSISNIVQEMKKKYEIYLQLNTEDEHKIVKEYIHELTKNPISVGKYLSIKNNLDQDAWISYYAKFMHDRLQNNKSLTRHGMFPQTILEEVIHTSLQDFAKRLLLQYIYFDVIPEFMESQEALSKGFVLEYFIWRNINDEKTKPAPPNLAISRENFFNYRSNRFDNAWSNEQLDTFIKTTILPKLLREYGIKININHMMYKTILAPFFKPGSGLGWNAHKVDLISQYVRSHSDWVGPGGAILPIFNLNKFQCNNDRKLPGIHKYIFRLKCAQQKVKKDLEEKLKNISKDKKHRFKWQNLCSANKISQLELEDLRELAIYESIPYAELMEKRELCSEFAKRFQNVIDGKKKIESKCINTTSITLTDLKDIPPEFFYAYNHNNKVYCDDIRDLVQHFETNGNTHPIDRSPIQQRFVDRIKHKYRFLQQTTNTMEDFNIITPQLPVSSILSSKATTFASKLNYPNDISLFINADKQLIQTFVAELVQEGILSRQEAVSMTVVNDLTSYKITLLELLLVKIKNDPQQIIILNSRTPLSSVAINITNIYNSIFKRN
jgi:uncharacterized cysteine cluster protein YcgN (CxxCxxCC family)